MGRSAGLLLAIGLVSPGASAGEPLVLPSDPAPAPLAATGDLPKATAVALSTDGASAAAAFLAGKDDDEARIVVVLRGGEPFDGFVKGRVVSLRLTGGTALGLVERFDRKGRRSATLVAVESGSDRRPREIVLPPSAKALDLLVSEGTLFVAAEDEIRTFDAATLRSGFLYSVRGPNSAVAAVPGGTRLLVGRPDGVLLVDLADPQGREGLAARGRAETPAPVVEIVASPDGDRALARLEDGTVVEIGLDPPGVTATGRTGSAILWPGTPVARPEPSPEPEPRSEAVLEGEPLQPPSPLPPVPEPEPHGGREVVDADHPSPAKSQSFQEVTPDAPRTEIPSETSRGKPPQPTGDSAESIHNLAATVVAGRLRGPAASEVVAVVLLGPDNLLREAARVAPRADGTWVAEGLAPGSYRAVLDGGSGRVLLSSPPFVSFRLVAGGRVEVPDLEVRRSVR